MALDNIAVIGAGLMGHGIALCMARAGKSVALFDPSAEIRQSVGGRIHNSMLAMGVSEDEAEAALKRIEIFDSLAATVRNADIVFEAAPEKPELKKSIFAEVEAAAPETAILASNTSVIPITTIMGDLSKRHRALGTHWWNPPHMIPLVEVIRTEWTDEAAMAATVDLLAEAGKTPARVEKDVAGFIGNRLQHAMWREAINLVEQGVCDAKTVDDVVKASFGRRLAVLGPIENADLVGTDLTLDIHTQLFAALDSRPAPSPYLEKLVADGRLGMKTGDGFRQWTEAEAKEVHQRVASHLRRLAEILED